MTTLHTSTGAKAAAILGFETFPGIFFLGAKASFVNGTTVE